MNLKCSPPSPASKRLAPGRLRAPAKFAEYELLRCSAGVPDGLCRGKEVFLVPGKTWPASLTSSEPSGRLRPPAKFSWYPARLGRRP